jgi:hypothetical protein
MCISELLVPFKLVLVVGGLCVKISVAFVPLQGYVSVMWLEHRFNLVTVLAGRNQFRVVGYASHVFFFVS